MNFADFATWIEPLSQLIITMACMKFLITKG